MNRTNNLNLKLLEYNQAQKEIVINEAITLFDALLNKSVISFVDKGPENKNDGDVYIISTNNCQNTTKADGDLLIYLNGWRNIRPKEGWRFWVISENSYYIFQEGTWSSVGHNSSVTFSPENQEISISFKKANLYKINLNKNVAISLEDTKGKNSKIELALIGKNDVEVKWGKEIKWSGEPCLKIKQNSYHLIEIHHLDGIFLCRNIQF
jgi:hypothetical protein